MCDFDQGEPPKSDKPDPVSPKYKFDEDAMRERLGLGPRSHSMPNYRAEVSTDMWVAPGSIQEPKPPFGDKPDQPPN